MSLQPPPGVYGSDGLLGTLSTESPSTGKERVIHLAAGGDAVVPADVLTPRAGGGYFLPLSLEELRHASSANELQAGQTVTLPVAREELVVGKRSKETSKVVVHVSPGVRTETVDVSLADEKVEVERVPINRVVQAAEPVREAGTVTIIPIYEEILVVEKRLVLKEEVRITRHKIERREKQEVALRTEEVSVTRTEKKE